MKHPVLTKVFGIVLAILCLLMLGVGIRGCVTSVNDYNEANEAYGNLLSKISKMIDLDRKINGGKFSHEAQATELERLQKQYDEDSAAHRTDVTTYTATEAGAVMGQSALSQAADTMEKAWAQYYAGLEIYEQGKAAFDEGYAQYMSARQQLDAGWEEYYAGVEQLKSGREQCEAGYAALEEVAVRVYQACSALDAMKQRYADVQATHADDKNARDALFQQVTDARNAYNTANTAYLSNLSSLNDLQSVYSDALSNIEIMVAEGMDHDTAYATEDAKCRLSSGGLGIAELGEKIEADRSQVEAEGAQVAQLMAAYDTLNNEYNAVNEQYNSDEAFLLVAPLGIAIMEPQVTSAEQLLADGRAQLDTAMAQIVEGEAMLVPAREQLEAGEAELEKSRPAIEQGKAELEAGKAELDAAKAQLDEGQFMLDSSAGQLAGVLGELKDTAERLESEKAALDDTSSLINEMKTSVAEYEQMQKDYESGRVVLMRYEGIREGVEDDGLDLLSAANAYAKQTRSENLLTLIFRLVSMGMAIAAAVLGVLGALKVFELLPTAPAAIKLTAGAAFGSLAAILINVALGNRIMATASFVIIFAAIQWALLREKKPKAAAVE